MLPKRFDLAKAGKEMSKKWGLKGNLGLASLGKETILLEFELKVEAQRVLNRGSKLFSCFDIALSQWNPREGWCLKEEGIPRETWVRIVGLPFHLWEVGILEQLGDACGGFVDADINTRTPVDL